MEIPSTSQTEKAMLGEGYNTKEERFVGECVMGNIVYAGAPEASIQYDRSMSTTEMADSLGFEAKARAQYGLISGSLSAKFASESSASDFSEVTVYSAHYRFKNAKLHYTGLTPVGEAAKGSSSNSNFTWENWEKTCGHEYVSEVVLGASLFISCEVAFSTKADKESFNAEFNIKGPMFGASGMLNKASAKFGSRATVTIRAYQLGGEVSALSRALSAEIKVNGQNVSALINCSMENPGACLAVLDRAVDYATKEFPEQIKPQSHLGDPAGPAELVYVTSRWEDLALYTPPALIVEAVKVARNDLSFQFQQNLKYRNRVRALRSGQFLLSARQQKRIEQIDEDVSHNFSLINEAATVCYTQMDKCVAKVDEVKGKLKSFTEEDFEIHPESFAQWYSIKDLPGTEKAKKLTVDRLVEIVKAKLNDFSNVKDKARRAEELLNELPALHLQVKNIVELQPISSLTKLKSLWLSSNQITNVEPLRFLTGLTSLRLAYNQIEDVSALAALTNLTELVLDGNRIKNVSSLAALNKLNSLSIKGTPIENIKSLSSLPLSNLFVTADRISVVEGANGEWQGTWVRRSQSNIFDVSWRNTKTGNDYSSRDTIELRAIQGQNVTFYCQNQQKFYYGTLSPDRQEVVSGTATYSAGYNWTAKATKN